MDDDLEEIVTRVDEGGLRAESRRGLVWVPFYCNMSSVSRRRKGQGEKARDVRCSGMESINSFSLESSSDTTL